MAGNGDLHKANQAKKDEFYTPINVIEAEMRHYRDYFRGKVILCNCDDPYESNFFKFFAANFNFLGLKKLIATCYTGSPIANVQLSLFDEEPPEDRTTRVAHKIEIVEVNDENLDGAINLADVEYLLANRKNVLTRLTGNGDFRSEECVALLCEADIVVTNPPFSLFREYVAQLVAYNKKFIILGNVNAVTYKEIFPLIAQNRLWLGVSIHSGDREFRVPDNYPLTAAGCRVDENGIKYIRVKGVRWFTNLDVPGRHESLTLYKRYTPEEYPHYDNYDAINVDKVTDIPLDWDGVMGVPITFLDKYSPEQFEIVAFRKGDDGKDLVYSFSEHSPAVNIEFDAAGVGRCNRTVQPDGATLLPYAHSMPSDIQRLTESAPMSMANANMQEFSFDDVIRPILNGRNIYRRITIRRRRPKGASKHGY